MRGRLKRGEGGQKLFMGVKRGGEERKGEGRGEEEGVGGEEPRIGG